MCADRPDRLSALLYYDYALTFPSELKYVWQRNILQLSTVVYALCRYALLANVLFLLAIANLLGSQVRTTEFI